MKKIASMVTSLLILMGTPALAGTSAQVEYGTVQESHILTQEAAPQQGGARPAFFKIVVAQSCFKQPLFAPARVSRAAPDLASRHR